MSFFSLTKEEVDWLLKNHEQFEKETGFYYGNPRYTIPSLHGELNILKRVRKANDFFVLLKKIFGS